MPRQHSTSTSSSPTKPYNRPTAAGNVSSNVPQQSTIRDEYASSQASGTRTPDAAAILRNQIAVAAAAENPSMFRPLAVARPVQMSIETSTVKPRRLATPAFKYLHRIEKDQVIDQQAFQDGLKAIYGVGHYIINSERNGSVYMIHGSKQHPYDLLAELQRMDIGAVWQVCNIVHYIPKSEIRNQAEFERALSTLYGPGHVYMIDAAHLTAVHVSQPFPSNLLATLKIMRLGGVWMSDDIPLFYEW